MRFINISWVCDGMAHCSNGADEALSLCPITVSTPSSRDVPTEYMDGNLHLCTEEEFECASGQCIQLNLLCDSIVHCRDGSDEGENCS